MFAHNEDLSDAKELTHEGHEAASSTRYHFEDDSLYIHPDIKDWTAITGRFTDPSIAFVSLMSKY